MDGEQARLLATYNVWMNEKLYAACATLSDEERKRARGAFFGSIHGTLNHLLLADSVWFGRFVGEPFAVRSLDQELYADFDELRAQRGVLDARIAAWTNALTAAELRGELRYRTITNPGERTCKLWKALVHFFNHQTHHRGQLTTLLSQSGVDYGVTDLLWMPGVLD